MISGASLHDLFFTFFTIIINNTLLLCITKFFFLRKKKTFRCVMVHCCVELEALSIVDYV